MAMRVPIEESEMKYIRFVKDGNYHILQNTLTGRYEAWHCDNNSKRHTIVYKGMNLTFSCSVNDIEFEEEE